MTGASRNPRRNLSRALTCIANADVAQTLAAQDRPSPDGLPRIGITGAPGAGKSSLIARLAGLRKGTNRKVAVLAVDPSSPVSHGSILGDRIRMDAIADDPDVFIRSIPSRRAHDGLADNTADLLNAMEGHGFDEIILETVGVGQADYTIRTLVDTVVLVLVPHSGDAIQAMKAGILEMADIYVVNKADLPGADLMAAEIEQVIGVVAHRIAAGGALVGRRQPDIGDADPGALAFTDLRLAYGPARSKPGRPIAVLRSSPRAARKRRGS